MITPDHVENIPAGHEQTFACEYENAEDLTIKYELVPPATPDDYYQRWEESYERTINGGRKKIKVQMYSNLKLVICTFRNKDNVEIGKIAAMIKVTGSIKSKGKSKSRNRFLAIVTSLGSFI